MINASVDLTRLRGLAISDTGFVFDPQTGHTYSFNETALSVLRALLAGDAPRAIADQLATRFDVAPEDDVARDVDEMLARLREEGLLR
jgi:PqqD family protein of HPr-rel-A system